MGMDSIIHIKLLCRVLPWPHQGSPFLARSRQCWSQVPASSVPALASPVPQRHLFMGATLSPRGKLSLGQRRAKCQTTRVPAARGHQVSGERGFSQQGVKEKTRKPTGRASTPWGPGGRGENSKLFAAVHRKREGVGGGSVSSTAELWWGDSVVGYMPSSLPQTA